MLLGANRNVELSTARRNENYKVAGAKLQEQNLPQELVQPSISWSKSQNIRKMRRPKRHGKISE